MIDIGFLARPAEIETEAQRAVAAELAAVGGARVRRCPRCQAPGYVRIEGCDTCMACGYSRCA
jgi:ribonucleoside-diphosphate reductase alpha chain